MNSLNNTNDSVGNTSASDPSVRTIPCIICSHNLSVAVSVVQVFIGIFVTTENAVTIITLVQCRGVKKMLKLLLINQSVTDAIFGVVYIYHSVVVYIIWDNMPECIVRYGAVSVSSAVSLKTVTILSVERLIAIKFPYKYQELMSTRTANVIGVVCWLVPVTVIVTGFVFVETHVSECNFILLASPTTLYVFAVPSLTLITVIIVSNIYLFMAAREHIRNIIPTFIGKEKYIQNIKMNLKATLTSASVVIPFLVLNAPQYVFFLVLAVRPSLRYHLETLYVMNFVSSMVMLNSVVNPIIYTWRVEELRTKLIRVLYHQLFCTTRKTEQPGN